MLRLFTPVRSFSLSVSRASWPQSKTGKPLTPFFAWCKDERARLMSEQPDISVPSLGKELGRLWKELPEDERLKWKEGYEKVRPERKTK